MDSFTLIVGPVGSGKALRLLSEIKPFFVKKWIIVCNSENKYSVDHNKIHYTDTLSEVMLEEYDIIGILGGHLFEEDEVLRTITYLSSKSKTLFMSYANADHSITPSKSLAALYVMADNIIKLRARCYSCHNPALYTSKTSEGFQPRCAICWVP
jgi:Thymidine kinase